MDFIKLNEPEPGDFNVPRFDGDDPLDLAEKHRSFVVTARENLELAKKFCQQQQHATRRSVEASEAAKLWLQQLEGGWGAPIAHVGPATLYEFWLEVPGFSGPVRGFSASTSQTGQIQHISHVKSTTTSGAGCATLGCLAGGPLGAILGATMGKKNDVRTDVQTVDNRRFEIQVIGPGVAWSHVGNHSIEDSVRRFRDGLLARSTNTDDPKVLAVGQREEVAVKDRSTDLEYMKLKDADDFLKNATTSLESAWSDYEHVRLPVRADLIARWKRCSTSAKTLAIVLGPVLTISWIAAIVIASNMNDPNSPGIIVIAVFAGILQLLALALFGSYYREEVRLVRALSSESKPLQPIYSFIDRLHKWSAGS